MNSIQQAILNEYGARLGLTINNAHEKDRKTFAITSKTIVAESEVSNLEIAIENFKSQSERNNRISETNITEAFRFITRKVASSSKENKFSKLFIPPLVDSETDGAIIRNGAIYGHKRTSDRTNSITLDENTVTSVFHGTDFHSKTKVEKEKSADNYMSTNFSIVPVNKISRKTTLIITVEMQGVESVSDLLIDMDKNRSIKIFIKEPARKDYQLISDDSGSIIRKNINKEIVALKILIDTKSIDPKGGIFFNRFSINRYTLSDDTSIDIKTNIVTNGDLLEVIRCDSNNNNIKYLLSVNGRPFKDATESPVRAYGIEDGDIYQLGMIEAKTRNGSEIRVFQIPLDSITIDSNEWEAFIGLNRYKEVTYGVFDYWEAYAVYRDIHTIEIPAGKPIYINGRNLTGSVVMYPGVYKIGIPKALYTKSHSLEFYSGIKYDGNTILLIRENGVTDSIVSIGDIFAEIETTASQVFMDKKDIENIMEDGIFELETQKNTVHVGFSPSRPEIKNLKIRVLFNKSSKIAKVDHLAVKVI